MPSGVKRKVSTTSFSGALQSSLGITPAGGKRPKTITRKEKRKAERIKKRKPSGQARAAEERRSVSAHAQSHGANAHSTDPVKKTSVASTSFSKEKRKQRKDKQGSSVPSHFLSVSEDPEDQEIARLEKLLGVSSKGKNKEKSASKLNKELEMYEGIGGKFGDFLMQLDDFAQYAHSDGQKQTSFVGDSDSEGEEEGGMRRGLLLNDSDQEASDVDDIADMDVSGSEDGDSDASNSDQEEKEEEGEGWFDDVAEYTLPKQQQQEESHNASGSEEESSDYDGSDNDSDSGDPDYDNDHAPGSTYRPVVGEDIYGRRVDMSTVSSSAPARYMPPAVRKKMEEEQRAQEMSTSTHSDTTSGAGKRAAMSIVDDKSEQARVLKRKINGLLNRLSEQSRDSIVKGLQEIFAQNSFTLCCHLLKECLLSVCSNATQLMSTLIPHYAGLVAALHFSVDFQIGSYILESLVVKLYALLQENNKSPSSAEADEAAQHSLISNKTASNLLLIVTHLYNLRVVHHSLVMDLFFLLVNEHKPPIPGNVYSGLTTLRVELIVCIVENCGQSLRGDDPVGLKQGILKVMKMTQTNKAGEVEDGGGVRSDVDRGRVKFMLSALSDLKNNKSTSRRLQSAHSEGVQHMRRWLGRVKVAAAGGGASGDACLHISLLDFLQAEERGRWWRAGASWGGRTTQQEGRGQGQRGAADTAAKQQRVLVASKESTPNEEKQLLKVARKLGMNTDIRQQIFLVVMSSRDVTDAFERLARLDLKGKQDREVVRVLAECCGSEKLYNEFYSELATLFCLQNRQYKITLQYAFWDLFKVLCEEDPQAKKKKTDRRAINMARMLAHLTVNFHMSLSVLKVIDISEISSSMLLFLATYFMSLFSAKISNETFMSILDRVATTSDCLVVREFVLIFLQHHFKQIPRGLPAPETKLMERRRKETIRTMEAMSVLDIAQGVAERDSGGGSYGYDTHQSKRKKGTSQSEFDNF